MFKRFHAIEFEDFSWFPKILRDPMTAMLFISHKVVKINRYVTPIIAELSQKHSMNRVIDLGSGGGGPTPLFAKDACDQNLDIQFLMTDLYPCDGHEEVADRTMLPNLAFYPDSVDATDVPAELTGIRTMHTCFHHMKAGQAEKILSDSLGKQQPIVITEPFNRTFLSLFGLLWSPVMALFYMPFVRPFKWQYFVLTYIIPLIPFFFLWDGVASWLRIYTPKELEELVRPYKSKYYSWKIISKGLGQAIVLVGSPGEEIECLD